MTVHIVGASIVVFLLPLISQSEGAGCNGYRMKVFDITNRCPGGNELVEFKDFKLDFSNDCKVIANGCITLKRTFTSAQQTRCYDRTPLLDISQFAGHLQMASGPTNMIIDTDHADAGRSCVKLRVNIGK